MAKKGYRAYRTWTQAEDDAVINALRHHTKLQDVADELEEVLDRTWSAIMNRARILSKDVPEFHMASTRRRWTAQEDRYLQEHWGQQTPEEIAEHLDRSVGAVKMRASVRGVAPRKRRSSNE